MTTIANETTSGTDLDASRDAALKELDHDIIVSAREEIEFAMLVFARLQAEHEADRYVGGDTNPDFERLGASLRRAWHHVDTVVGHPSGSTGFHRLQSEGGAEVTP